MRCGLPFNYWGHSAYSELDQVHSRPTHPAVMTRSSPLLAGQHAGDLGADADAAPGAEGAPVQILSARPLRLAASEDHGSAR
jgi:hypothetical protein